MQFNEEDMFVSEGNHDVHVLSLGDRENFRTNNGTQLFCDKMATGFCRSLLHGVEIIQIPFVMRTILTQDGNQCYICDVADVDGLQWTLDANWMILQSSDSEVEAFLLALQVAARRFPTCDLSMLDSEDLTDRTGLMSHEFQSRCIARCFSSSSSSPAAMSLSDDDDIEF